MVANFASICLESKVPEKSISFCFCYWFWLVFIKFYSLESFFKPALADGFPMESTWQQVPSSLQDSSRYFARSQDLISESSSLWTNLLVTVSSAAITVGIIVTFILPSIFNSLARFRYLSFFSLSFNFTLWLAGTAKSTIRRVLVFFCFFLLLFGLVVWSRLDDSFVFHTSISWWFFTGVWVTASPLKSLGLLSVF